VRNCGKTTPIAFFAEVTPMVKVDFPFPLDEHGGLIVALAPLFKVLQDHAKRGDCTFPVELLLIDEDDSILFDAELQSPEGPATSLRDPNAKLASIHWPVTVRATDAAGREWEQTIAGPTVQ
jgi:hypothetical protein